MSTLFSHFFTKINQISPLEHNFTEVLNSIALKPKILYFRGKLPENMVKSVAIVGSRHNTRYGEEVAYQLAYELGKRGVVVISGLAYGIDSIAHKGCLAANGTTIAVLGTPIDSIYPTTHESIARQIVQQDGAIISEYPPDTNEYLNSPLAPGEAGWNGVNWVGYDAENSEDAVNNPLPRAPYRRRRLDRKLSFLYRNRLIAGLADIVVVVEAAEKSGSLNTATHALNQGKDVFAVPGNITNPYSQGCNKLIRQGALPYTEPSDILRELFPKDYAKQHKHLQQLRLFGDTDVETKILQSIAAGARTGDEIMSETHLPPEVFNEAVTLLEIKSRIRALGLNRWNLT